MSEIETTELYTWDPMSFGRKLISDTSITVGSVNSVSVTKHIGPNDSKRDAYRNCAKCHKHFNYHGINGECPK